MKKSLFLTPILLIALLAAPQAEAADAAVLASLKKNGALVLPYPGKADHFEVEFHLRGRDLTDEGLADVAALKNVVTLNLRDTKITGAGLVHLKGLTQLTRLHLERTKIDDAGIANLASLQNLEYLNLYGTEVTDKALDHLAGLKNLKKLFVWQTKVTDDGVAKLKKAIPDIKIVQGVDLSKVVVVKEPEPKPEDNLKWVKVLPDKNPPSSKPGTFTNIIFENKSGKKVKVYWMEYTGGRRLYGEIAPNGTRKQNTYSQAVWLVTDEKDKPLGYFVTTQKIAKAIIPKAN